MNLTSRSASTLALFAVALSAAHAEMIFGASPTSLYSFDSASPAAYSTIGAFSGVVAGQTIRSIDFRPANGMLYALSSNAAAAQLYTVNLATGALTTVGSGFTITGNASTRISMDFNPTVDRIRVVTGSGFNYRVNPNDSLVAGVDTTISSNYLMSGIAYTNSVAGATSTTLYSYDFSGDTLNTIGSVGGTPTSPNSGTVFQVGPSGKVASTAAIGFDISGATGVGYIAYNEASSAGSNSEFYTVNLGTGLLTQVGANEALPNFVGLSVAPRANPVPEPATLAALGLGALAFVKRRKRA